MEYLIKLLGDYSIGWAITLIAALVFLWLCYRKVEKCIQNGMSKALKSSSNLTKVSQS